MTATPGWATLCLIVTLLQVVHTDFVFVFLLILVLLRIIQMLARRYQNFSEGQQDP